MNPTAPVLVSVLLAAAAAVGVTFALRPAEAPSEAPAIAELQRTLASLRTDQLALQQKIEAIASAAAPVTAKDSVERTAAPVVSADLVATAVEAYLSKRGAAGSPGQPTAATAAATFDLDSEFAKLVGTNFFEDSELWKRLLAAGKMDEAIAKFEALAKASPQDTKVQMDLAQAYLAYVNMDQTKYQYSMKADSVFDEVLALDERHWEARFTKAMSYTFWPDFLGKKKDAISHFETLVTQQESMPAQSHEAQTYLYLGNMLEARDLAKAKEIWAKGARRHPDNQDLKKRAGN